MDREEVRRLRCASAYCRRLSLCGDGEKPCRLQSVATAQGLAVEGVPVKMLVETRLTRVKASVLSRSTHSPCHM